MIYSVEFEPQAINDLNVLDRNIRDRILRKINWLSNNFDQITPQALTGDLTGFFKPRVNPYKSILREWGSR